MRIFLTIPVTVSSENPTFSKLKLIPDFLRSTILEDILSSVENEISKNLEFSMLIKKIVQQ